MKVLGRKERKNLRCCLNDLDLVSSCDLANGGSPQFIKLLLIESLGPLAAHGRLKLVFSHRRRILFLAILTNKLSALILSSAISEFFNSSISYSFNAARF